MEDCGVFTATEGRALVPANYAPYQRVRHSLANCFQHDQVYEFLVGQRESNGASQLLCAEFDNQAARLPTTEVTRLGNHAARVAGIDETLFPFDGSAVLFGTGEDNDNGRTLPLAKLDFQTTGADRSTVLLETRFGENANIEFENEFAADRDQCVATIETLAARDMHLRGVYFGRFVKEDRLYNREWKTINRELLVPKYRNFDGSVHRNASNGGVVESDDWLRVCRSDGAI